MIQVDIPQPVRFCKIKWNETEQAEVRFYFFRWNMYNISVLFENLRARIWLQGWCCEFRTPLQVIEEQDE